MFIGSYKGNETIINKINREGFDKLTLDEKGKLSSFYDLESLDKKINKNTTLVKDFIKYR